MKVTAILIGSGGELDRRTIDFEDDDNSVTLDSLNDEIGDWLLSHGDTIKIEVGADATS